MKTHPAGRQIPKGARAVLALLALVVVDVAGGLLVGPGWGGEVYVEQDLRFDAVAVDQSNLTELQDDGLAFRYITVDRAEGLWSLNDATTPTTSWSRATGRRTWNPAVYGHRVAVVGGSSAFGIGQADDGTVASALARDLVAAGAPARVDNYGMLAYTLDQAALDLAARLEAGERFDVVVAFGGFNEVLLALAGLEVPATLRDIPAGPVDSGRRLGGPFAWSLLARLTGWHEPQVQTPLRRYPEIGGVVIDPREAAAAAAAGVTRGVEHLEALARTYGFTLVVVLTPSWLELPFDEQHAHRSVVDVDPWTAATINDVLVTMRADLQQRHRSMVTLPKSVVGGDCYIDLVHTVERCSPAIASAIAPSVLTAFPD